MSTFAIGDIHGNSDGLHDLLAQMSSEVCRGDVVVFLGDYIDRGPDSRGCIDAILRFRDSTPADVVCLIGNHEDWLLATRQDFCRHAWLRVMDAWDTIRSYSPEAESTLRRAAGDLRDGFYTDDVALPYELFFDAMPASHLSFLEELGTCHRSADAYCSHAGVVPAIRNLDAQPRHDLIWGASGFPSAYAGDELIVYGHWNNAAVDASGWPGPRFLNNTIGLDTSAFGVVTALRLPDRRVFQSAQHASAMATDKWKGN
jgi:serine/threonine protein phosphatase 1